MSHTKAALSPLELRDHLRTGCVLLLVLVGPFIVQLAYMILLEIVVPQVSMPKEFTKVFQVPGSPHPTKKNELLYDTYVMGWRKYYMHTYVTDLTYEEALSLIEQNSSECEMRTSNPSMEPFFVASPVMHCRQSALPDAAIDIEIQPLQDLQLNKVGWSGNHRDELIDRLAKQPSIYQTVIFVTVHWSTQF